MPLTPPPPAPPTAPDAPGPAPSRANPSTFRALADAFLQWQVGFRDSLAGHVGWLNEYLTWAGTHVTEMDALQEDVATKAGQVTTSAETVAADRSVVESISTSFGNLNTALTAAGASSVAAAGSASAAVSNAQRAEAALLQIYDLANITIDPATYLSELLAGYVNGITVDATNPNKNLAVQVKDTVTPANTYLGPMYGFLATTNFLGVKFIQKADGTLQWVDHNDVLQAETFTSASWTKLTCTPTAGSVGPDGTTNNATSLAATAAASNVSQNVTVLANMMRTWGFVVKAGTSAFCFIETSDSAVVKRAWFNLTTGATATVEAGVTAAVSNTFPDGTPMAAGWYWVSMTRRTVGTSVAIKLGLCDADNSTVTVSGRTLLATRAQGYRGTRRLGYLVTTTATVKGIPYDWSNGEQQLALDVAVNYRGRWGDDMTNAAWTATNITPAQNATGPHGEACSSITSTAANGTIIESVTSAGTVQNFHAWVRRKTGTGTLEMTVDNGSTWSDVTAQIGAAGGLYLPVYKRGALANPTVGFRIGTSGDAFEVALANVSATWHLPPPFPSAAIDNTSITDAFAVPFTKFPTATSMTMYADIVVPASNAGAASTRNKIGFTGAGSNVATVDVNPQTSGMLRLEHQTHDGVSHITPFGSMDTGPGRLQIQHRVTPNDYAICYNGNAVWWNPDPGVVTNTQMVITVAQRIFLRRILVVPEAIADRDDTLRTWHLDAAGQNVNTGIQATAWNYKFGDDPTVLTSRIPSVEVLYETGDKAGFVCVWGQKHNPGLDSEHPQRMVSRKWEFNRVTGILTPTTPVMTVLQTAGWATDSDGGVQGYTPFKIRFGKWRGRLGMLYVKQDGPGALASDARNIYCMYSDDNGTTYTAGVKVVDKATFIGATPGFVCTGENSTVFQLEDGPHAGRVYASFNMNNQEHGVMWTDDFTDAGDGSGAHWSVTPSPGRVPNDAGVIGTLTEPAVSFWPDGTIVIMFRNSGGGDVAWSKSVDWGNSFSAVVECGGDNLAWNVNCGFLQDDPLGLFGKYGRLICARATLNGRSGHKIQEAFDASMSWGRNYRVFGEPSYVGYCPTKKLFRDDNLYAINAERNPTTSGNYKESHLLVVFRY